MRIYVHLSAHIKYTNGLHLNSCCQIGGYDLVYFVENSVMFAWPPSWLEYQSHFQNATKDISTVELRSFGYDDALGQLSATSSGNRIKDMSFPLKLNGRLKTHRSKRDQTSRRNNKNNKIQGQHKKRTLMNYTDSCGAVYSFSYSYDSYPNCAVASIVSHLFIRSCIYSCMHLICSFDVSLSVSLSVSVSVRIGWAIACATSMSITQNCVATTAGIAVSSRV